MPKERLIGIDLLKVFAVFLVMNSHMGFCYGKYSYLATGGAIGDALFFFASGYTLLLSNRGGVFEYLYKRIIRIYPSLFSVAIIAQIFFDVKFDLLKVITGDKYWFISCILVYYLIFWPIKKYSKRINLWRLFILCSTIVLFLGLYNTDFTNTTNIYGGGTYRLIFYFIFMLLGAIMGSNKAKLTLIQIIIGLVVCILLFYGIIYLTPYSIFQTFSLIPLLGICFFLLLFCNSNYISHIIKPRKLISKAVFIIGSLCLDSYLIQKYIITDLFNSIFPANIPIVMILILIASYILNMCGNIIRGLITREKITFSSIALH